MFVKVAVMMLFQMYRSFIANKFDLFGVDVIFVTEIIPNNHTLVCR